MAAQRNVFDQAAHRAERFALLRPRRCVINQGISKLMSYLSWKDKIYLLAVFRSYPAKNIGIFH